MQCVISKWSFLQFTEKRRSEVSYGLPKKKVKFLTQKISEVKWGSWIVRAQAIINKLKVKTQKLVSDNLLSWPTVVFILQGKQAKQVYICIYYIRSSTLGRTDLQKYAWHEMMKQAFCPRFCMDQDLSLAGELTPLSALTMCI